MIYFAIHLRKIFNASEYIQEIFYTCENIQHILEEEKNEITSTTYKYISLSSEKI